MKSITFFNYIIVSLTLLDSLYSIPIPNVDSSNNSILLKESKLISNENLDLDNFDTFSTDIFINDIPSEENGILIETSNNNEKKGKYDIDEEDKVNISMNTVDTVKIKISDKEQKTTVTEKNSSIIVDDENASHSSTTNSHFSDTINIKNNVGDFNNSSNSDIISSTDKNNTINNNNINNNENNDMDSNDITKTINNDIDANKTYKLTTDSDNNPKSTDNSTDRSFASSNFNEINNDKNERNNDTKESNDSNSIMKEDSTDKIFDDYYENQSTTDDIFNTNIETNDYESTLKDDYSIPSIEFNPNNENIDNNNYNNVNRSSVKDNENSLNGTKRIIYISGVVMGVVLFFVVGNFVLKVKASHVINEFDVAPSDRSLSLDLESFDSIDYRASNLGSILSLETMEQYSEINQPYVLDDNNNKKNIAKIYEIKGYKDHIFNRPSDIFRSNSLNSLFNVSTNDSNSFVSSSYYQ